MGDPPTSQMLGCLAATEGREFGAVKEIDDPREIGPGHFSEGPADGFSEKKLGRPSSPFDGMREDFFVGLGFPFQLTK